MNLKVSPKTGFEWLLSQALSGALLGLGSGVQPSVFLQWVPNANRSVWESHFSLKLSVLSYYIICFPIFL